MRGLWVSDNDKLQTRIAALSSLIQQQQQGSNNANQKQQQQGSNNASPKGEEEPETVQEGGGEVRGAEGTVKGEGGNDTRRRSSLFFTKGFGKTGKGQQENAAQRSPGGEGEGTEKGPGEEGRKNGEGEEGRRNGGGEEGGSPTKRRSIFNWMPRPSPGRGSKAGERGGRTGGPEGMP